MRTIDPAQIWVRHVSRCLSTDTGAVKVGGVWFRANDIKGTNGESGWISGEVVGALSDDGSATLRFPNTTGADGQAHLDRFAVITDPSYRIGEEWFEIRRDVADVMAVATPSTPKINRTDITIEFVDPLALLTLTREEALHVWNASPRDVIDYYTRLEMPAAICDFRNKTVAELAALGWASTIAGGPAGIPITLGTFPTVLASIAAPPAINEAWTFSCSGAFGTTQDVDSFITVKVGGLAFDLYPHQTVSAFIGTVGASLESVETELKPGSSFDVRLWRRGEWLFVQYNGRTIGVVRAPSLGPGSISVGFESSNCAVTLRHAALSTIENFLAEPTAGDRHLPGAPTPGGLWATFYNEPDARSKANGVDATWQDLCLNPMLESTSQRMDPASHAAANPPAWQPPAVGAKYFSARWTGAIYLDLATADRNLQIVSGTNNRTRVWIGKTGPANQTPHISGTGTQTGTSLRTHLGQSLAGWYPIIIETDMRSGSGGMILKDRSGAGTYAQVGTDRLSPFGVFSDTVQRESHRAMVTQITETFGYQWTTEPKTLESGKFPGRVIPKVRAGRDTEKVISSDESSQMERTFSAVESCDRLLLDAAGLPTKDGAAGNHVEVFNDSTIRGHLFISTAYDQASEITDETMLRQRADSMLVLRAAGFEQIKVDPDGQHEVIDTWPLTGVLAKAKWEPGDGARLDLPEIGQVDASPRQFTGVTKPIFPDGVGQPSVTWRQRPRGAREMILRTLRNSQRMRRTYQNRMGTINGTPGANPTASSPTTPSILFLPAGSIVSLLELRIVYLSGSGSATIEINGSNTGQVVTAESPIDLTAYAAPFAAGDQRITARLISVTDLLVEIQLSAEVVK